MLSFGGKALISKNLLVDWDSWMLKVIQLCLGRCIFFSVDQSEKRCEGEVGKFGGLD